MMDRSLPVNARGLRGGGTALLTLPVAAAAAALLLAPARPAAAQGYVQTNLVTDDQSVNPAAHTDPNLINPWGISESGASPFWVSDNGAGVSTLYNTSGTPQALVVTIPPAPGAPAGTKSTPTGQVNNSFGGAAAGNNFRTSSGATVAFIFATEDGTIDAWGGSLGTNAALMVDNSASGAVYKGLAIGSAGGNNFLYAANFSQNRIDVFNGAYGAASGFSFLDPTLGAGYSPFNIQNLGGTLYVAYAKHAAGSGDEIAGTGFGVVDAFDTNGNFLRRIGTGTDPLLGGSISFLDAPWGLALAPSNFGQFSNDLIVGNFGSGQIGAFNPLTGAFLGLIRDTSGNPLAIDGLWGLTFGNGGNGGATNALYFAAGPGGEQHGLFGSITVSAPEPGSLALLGAAALPLLGVTVPLRRRRSRGVPAANPAA